MSAETAFDRPEQLQAYRLDLIARMADDLAHEIRNPLHALVINLEVLKRRMTSGAQEAALERAAVIEGELHRVHHTIDRLIRLLRPDHERASNAALASVFDDVVPLIELRARLARIEFQAESPDDSVSVPVPAEDLRFALLAIAETVLRRLHAGARLSITANLKTDIEVQVRGENLAQDVPENDEEIERATRFASTLLEPVGGEALRTGTEGRTLTVILRVPRVA